MNQDLWMQMDTLMVGRKITRKWVKGHAGHPENERVDALANGAAQQATRY
nr:RNase H family protein [Microvirga vignae]